MNVRIIPLMLIVFTAVKALSQDLCPIDEKFPYDFCKNGTIVHRCSSDPWHTEENGVRLMPLRRAIPGCIRMEQRNTLDIRLRTIVTGGPDDLVTVFRSEEQEVDVAEGFGQWATLCPESGKSDCCANVYFSTNPLDFDDPNQTGFSYTDYNTATCKPTCSGSNRIVVNSTPYWYYRLVAPNPSDNMVRSFFTGKEAPQVASGITIVSFYQTMEFLSGVWFGMRATRNFPETSGCAHPSSVMENPSTANDPTNLTPSDICQFRKLYCDHAVGLSVPDEDASASFTLSQNVPNPFSTMSTIAYTLQNAGVVHLSIFDDMGKEVKVLVDQDMQPGSYTCGFYADESMSAGHYWYVLRVDRVTVTKQMMLVK